MKWVEVREQYSNEWVLVEALEVESKDNKRFIYDMAVISNFENSTHAWKSYKELHLNNPSRELYIFHTSKDELEVIEEKFTGIRRRKTQ